MSDRVPGAPAGPLRNLYGLRLQVHHRQQYTERVNLTTREHVRTSQAERGVPFRSGHAYTLTAGTSSQTSEQNSGGGLKLLSRGADSTTTTTNTARGQIVATSGPTGDGSTGPLSLLGSAADVVATAADTVKAVTSPLLRSRG